jgi:Zn-dependent protease with chaperone function
MTTPLVMLGYAATLAWLGPVPLARLTTRGVNARLGLVVWLAAVASALGAALVAVSFLVRSAVAGWPTFAGTICRSVYGSACSPQVYRSALFELSLAAASAVAVLVLVTLTWQYGRSVQRARRRAREHAQAARITGRQFLATEIPPLSTAVVLEAPQPAVYCVPGRPATIVLTTGALAVLEPAQLHAVLAHERAHLAGRHHLLITLGKAMKAGLPGVPLVTRGAEEIARLGRLLDPPGWTRRACHGLALSAVLLTLAAASVLLPVLS